jgi:hypothetical protein
MAQIIVYAIELLLPSRGDNACILIHDEYPRELQVWHDALALVNVDKPGMFSSIKLESPKMTRIWDLAGEFDMNDGPRIMEQVGAFVHDLDEGELRWA